MIEDANVFKASRLASGKTFGFLVTSDGWWNHNRRQYHNFILVAASGPIYLGLKDVSGQSGNAQAIHDEFVDLFATLANDIVLRIIIGCTDTPSANVSAWKKLEATFPNQLWIGCMAHELSLLFKDWVKKIPEIKEPYIKGKRITIWIKNPVGWAMATGGRITRRQNPGGVSLPPGLLLLSNYDAILRGGPMDLRPTRVNSWWCSSGGGREVSRSGQRDGIHWWETTRGYCRDRQAGASAEGL